MGLVVFVIKVVAVVGGHHGNAEALSHIKEDVVHLELLGESVVLNLKIEVSFAKKLLVVKSQLVGLLHLSFHNQLGNLACQTGRKGYNPFAVLGQHLSVDTGLVIKTFELGDGGELAEVGVARIVFRQKHQVKEACSVFRTLFSLKPSRRHVGFKTHDGFDARFVGFVVELHCTEHHPVVGDGHRLHTILFGTGEKRIEANGPVQKAVLGVQMQMIKIRNVAGDFGHGLFLVVWESIWAQGMMIS